MPSRNILRIVLILLLVLVGGRDPLTYFANGDVHFHTLSTTQPTRTESPAQHGAIHHSASPDSTLGLNDCEALEPQLAFHLANGNGRAQSNLRLTPPIINQDLPPAWTQPEWRGRLAEDSASNWLGLPEASPHGGMLRHLAPVVLRV